MAVLDKLVFVLCLAAIAFARTTIRSLEQAQTQSPYVPNYFPQEVAREPTTSQQLPRIGANIPFNVPEPSGELTPPHSQERQVSFLEIPVPSTDLRVPSEEAWNPENNPIYYYELPASLTKLESPTNHYPKKYNKDVHSKNKAFSSKPKVEIELIPIEEKELISKKNALDKKYDQLAKIQNKKELENLQAQQAIQI